MSCKSSAGLLLGFSKPSKTNEYCAVKIDRKLADAIYRCHFGAFVYAAFEALNPKQRLVPNWHIDAVCHGIVQMLGRTRKRLVLNLPPRSLKSFVVSVCLPAWLLGRNPSARMICASYSQDLADKFSRDCRALLDTSFYKRCSPAPGSTQERPVKPSSRPHGAAIGWQLSSAVR